MLHFRSLCTALLLCGAAPASAQLAIDRLWVDFEPNITPRADVIIRNESKDRYYITVAPSEIVNPGTATEKRVEEADPDKLGLLVTPNRLILEPGGMRSIRIVSLNNALTSDRIYRVRISPQVGDIETTQSNVANRDMAIKLLAAYDVLVTARPNDAKAHLVTTQGDKTLVIRNDGNTNLLLFDGELCATQPAKSKNDTTACQGVGSHRMYPGTSWELKTGSSTDTLHARQRLYASTEPKSVVLP